MKGERGFSLLEVIIAMALLGIVAVALLSALATASRTVFITDERATAESLARTQMEYVRTCEYEFYDSDDLPQYEQDNVESPDNPGYFISVDAIPIDPYDGSDLADPDNDAGLQKIVVTVYFTSYDADENPNRQITLVGYKRGV